MTVDGKSPASDGLEDLDGAFDGDGAAVSELIGDIEAELRLHQARVQEFLDGTREFGAIKAPDQRARLIHTAQALSSALADLTPLLR